MDPSLATISEEQFQRCLIVLQCSFETNGCRAEMGSTSLLEWSSCVELYALNAEEPPYNSNFIVDARWLPGGADYDPHEWPANLRQGGELQSVQLTDTEEATNPVQPDGTEPTEDQMYTDEEAEPILYRMTATNVRHHCSFRRDGPGQYTLDRKPFETRDMWRGERGQLWQIDYRADSF